VGGFGIASLLCALAPSSNLLIAARGIQGITGALLTPASLAVIVSTFEGDERGAAIGTWTAWSGISTIFGPLLGGWLLGIASWRWIFLINVPLVAVTLALVLVVVPGRARGSKHVRVDVVGAVLCVLALGGTVFGFIEQPRLGWSHPAIVGSLAGGVAMFALFLVYEARASHPMLPLRLFASRNFSVTNVETLLVYAGLSTLAFFLVLFLQQIAGYSALESGFALMPVTVVMFVLSPRVGRLSSRFGPRLFMSVGPILAGLGLLPLVRMDAHVSYWTDLLAPVLVFSLGLTLTVAPLTSTVLSEAGPSDAGIASGVNNAVARVAGLLGIALVGLAVANRANRLDAHGFHLAMLITAALVVAGGVIGALGIRNPERTSEAEPHAAAVGRSG
jgi:EmrB/QacA subfamily drug resistance transporter